MNIDIEKLSVNELKKKSTYHEIFNLYTGEELDTACEKLLARAEMLEDVEEVEDLVEVVKFYIREFLDRSKRKEEAIEEKNRRLQWHLEIKKRREYEEERKRTKARLRELDKIEKEELEKLRRVELEEIKKNLKDTLDVSDEDFKDLVDNRFIYKNNGDLNCKNPINYDLVVQNDKFIKEHVRYNEFSNNLEFDGHPFENKNLLTIISYFDRIYRLTDPQGSFIWNALNRPGNILSYHPIKDLIEEDAWDGVPRIDTFFQEVCKSIVKDDDSRTYLREVARMLFFGGITRLYEPGSKFDYMIILKGAQGTCKTTLVRMLALDDSAYSEVTSIDGTPGIENIRGSWMCELAELLAMVRAREVESIKAFITRQYDKYRPPYARTSEIIPRSCIFIGTTNEIQFMGDMTGNRRYLPVEVNTNATEFFEHEEDIHNYILMCWREAFYKYLHHETYTTIPARYFDLLEDVRSSYVDDDPMEGLIRGYLADKEVGYKVCGLELYIKCLNGVRSKYTTRDSRNIATVMNKLHNWVRYNERESFTEEGYGQQRYWKKVSDN